MAVSSEIYEFDGCVLDAGKRALSRADGSAVHLTSREFDFLRFILKDKVENFERAIPRSELRNEFWDRDDDSAEGNLRELCGRIREKFGDKGADLHKHISTEVEGYIKFVPSVTRKPMEAKLPEEPRVPPVSAPSLLPKPGSSYYVISRGTNLALDVPGAEDKNQPIQLWRLPGWIDNQLWRFVSVDEGHFTVRSKSCPARCLDVESGGTDDGTRVLNWQIEHAPHQQWRVEQTELGCFRLLARHSGQALDRDDRSFADGAPVQVWNLNSWANQEWDIVREDHLLVGRHFLVDGRCGNSGEGNNRHGLSLVLGLLVELARRRATFTCWFARDEHSDPEADVIEDLCQRFPTGFEKAPGGFDVTDALAIAALGNPKATVITQEFVASHLSNRAGTFGPRIMVADSTPYWLRVAALDVLAKAGEQTSILSARLTPSWSDGKKDHIVWQKVAGGKVPAGALVGGLDTDQTPLYVCRAMHNGSFHPGAVVNGMCNIGYAGREIPIREYEVPVTADGREWSKAEPGCGGALVAGEEDGNPLIVCQAEYAGGLYPGKLVNGQCHFGYRGLEKHSDLMNFRVYTIPRN